jgi:hypothetical protein
MSPEEATCLEGAQLAALIDRQGIDRRALSPSDLRAIQRWRRGDQVRYYTADRILTRLGLSLHDIPDACWRSYRNGRQGWRKQAA